jgi:hypothetical protein
MCHHTTLATVQVDKLLSGLLWRGRDRHCLSPCGDSTQPLGYMTTKMHLHRLRCQSQVVARAPDYGDEAMCNPLTESVLRQRVWHGQVQV